MASSDFIKTQKAFANAIRNPASAHQLAIESRRLAIYQDLFFNNISGFVKQAFPVLASLYSNTDWQSMCGQFFNQHQNKSPYFTDLRNEFLTFLQHEYKMTVKDPVFIQELAHYEWLEMEIMQTSHLFKQANLNQVAEQSFYLAPTAQLVSYPYPVHKISQQWRPTESKSTTYLIVYLKTPYKAAFSEVSAATACVLELIKQNNSNRLYKLADSMQQMMPKQDFEVIIAGLRDSLATLADEGILLAREQF
ncbi:DNA-binding domain-containing protein [Gayadomonas joobiniege]|uniref:HvfC family RiPP maturation protein n=1 Tax=Gayadomonas joobiniege TaxID=1234606 RepID=UPI000365B58D|nr:putative DNA-binding domain-containing protein [Gayadomonas joobiniege]